MKHLSCHGPTRTAAFLLCLVFSCAAFWAGLLTLSNWGDLWSNGNYLDSYSAGRSLYSYSNYLDQVLQLHMRKEWKDDLTYLEEEQYAVLINLLKPSATNFRYRIHDQNGRLILENLDGMRLDESVKSMRTYTTSVSSGAQNYAEDIRISDVETGRELLQVYLNGNYVSCDPADTPVGQHNVYGYQSTGTSWTNYVQSKDSRRHSAELVLQFSIDPAITSATAPRDQLKSDYESYLQLQRWLPLIVIGAGVSLAGTLGLVIFLCRGAGRRRDSGEIALSWQERIPLDVYILTDCILVMLLVSAGDEVTYSFNVQPSVITFVGVSVLSLLMSAILLSALLTVVVRLKKHTFWSSMLWFHICITVWHKLREAFSGWPIISRAVLLFLIYLAGSVLTAFTLVLFPVFQAFVLWHLCRWIKQWRSIREGTRLILDGASDTKINTDRFYPDLREHADQLNDLGSGMARAVDERIKGERFKAELITNVSHDLKTPLTSIISYVDLLRKVGIEDPKALEYIDVLDRKSQRLKKLTEDLVEASKASTGNLTVTRERLGFTQLLDQALGEYQEKLSLCGLSTVISTPDHEVYVEADGRHLWRVIDNLLSNCVKYAMPGTRVYVDVKVWDHTVCLSMKNISQNPLNIPSDQLMERFVRGDESRSAEGSGLGLSIASSLTELQCGTFRLDIDGDLFKAVVTFPECRLSLPTEPVESL